MSGRVILAFIFGAAAGGAGVYFGLKDFYEKQTEAEIDEMRAYYEEKINGIKDAVKGLESPKNGQKRPLEQLEEDKTDYQEIIKTLNYNTVAKKSENTEEEATHADKEYISYDEYVKPYKGYEKVEYDYFSDDDTLIDEEEEMIDNEDYLFPSDWRDKFGDELFEQGPDDIICVRNFKSGMDIMVNKHENAYSELIDE